MELFEQASTLHKTIKKWFFIDACGPLASYTSNLPPPCGDIGALTEA
jgi:hypothetical protein